MIKNIISRLTMVKISTKGFWDTVDNKKIYYWQDCYFNCYMASNRFDYRVKINRL